MSRYRYSDYGSILDVPPGTPVQGESPNVVNLDFTALLPAELRSTLQLVVSRVKGSTEFEAVLLRRGELPPGTNPLAGAISGWLKPTRPGDAPTVMVKDTYISKSLMGKGIGKAMYEAYYRAAYDLGARTVFGGAHSTLAHRVHESLRRKHGWEYLEESRPNIGPSRWGGGYQSEVDWNSFDPNDLTQLSMDHRWTGYRHTLSDYDLEAEVEEWDDEDML